ncbi:MAG: exonuclease domain-containing protein [Paracoccaceae bacterium]|jgi:DNA polymerase-3 subunit epsilon|nr:exonuclease domain-containing protein [Paracoccaceae bacterium]
MLERLARLPLRLRVFLFFAALGLGAFAAIGLGLWAGLARLDDALRAEALTGFVVAGLVAGFATLALTAWVWLMFDENVARAIQRIAGALRTRAHADVAGALDAEQARFLGDLAPAAQAVTGTLAETRNALAEAVERETTRLAVENARLAALLADVPAGVLLCSADHQIVFYNGPAQAILSGEHAPGLNRSILDYLRPGPVQAAHARLTRAGRRREATDLICAATQAGDGAGVLAGRMRLVDLPQHRGEAPGYVLTLRDVTADLALHAAREALLDEVFDRVRRPAANLQTVLSSGAAQDADGRAALLDEAEHLAAAITELGARYDAARGRWWPMAETRAADLAEAVVAQAGVALAIDAADMTLRCDAVQLVALLARLAERLSQEHGAGALALAMEAEPDGGALLTLRWDGPVLPVSTLERWLGLPLEVGLADITGRSVLAAHGTEAWPGPGRGGRAALCLPLPAPAESRALPAAETRRAVYDFDLLDRAPTGALAETRLRDLTCVVFDTETTGLLPSSGDEIVQIAALRMVGGRRVAGEQFESLVNPGRPIPAGATAVHRIADADVAGAPPIETVARRFHGFAAGAVLVAHNAPFDLEFLRRHEAATGVVFDHPVLDTVLLSAVVFGQSETHTLDALTERLGIEIPPEARHTAMGDTIATAAALEKLIPLLEARGLATFGQTVAAVRRHARLLKDANLAQPVPA